MTEMLAEGAGDLAGKTWTRYTPVERTLLAIGAVVCLLLFNSLGRVLKVPQDYAYSSSIFQHRSPLVIILACAVLFVACVMIASLVASVVRFEAGLYCAAIGLAALSIRGGPMRFTLMSAGGPGIFLVLALELIVLYAIVFLGWLTLTFLRGRNLLKSEHARETGRVEDDDSIPSQGALAMVTQIILMIFCMSFLSQTDAKGQAIASVAASAFLATLAAHTIFPVRPSTWFWIGPLVVGIIGYAFAYFGNGPWTNGEVPGKASFLAMPLPLDYATAGPAGAILAYWTSSRWHANAREAAAEKSH